MNGACWLACRLSIPNAVGSCIFALTAWHVGPLKAAFIFVGTFMLYLLGQLLSQPDHNIGHRSGAIGFRGKLQILDASALSMPKWLMPACLV